MKFRSLFAVSVAATLALSGCGGDEADPVAETPGNDNSSAAPAAEGGDKTQVRLWLVGTDTPQPVRDYAEAEFEKANPTADLVIEEQVWDGLVDKLTTALSGSDSPDVVEVGNTQAVAFTSAGAFEDISSMKEELGGDDLLSGFVEAGTYDGKLFAAPYYAGSRLVFYRKDQFKQAGVVVPTTLDEYVAAGKKLKESNSAANYSGIWWPGQDWRNGLPFIWAAGGDIAAEEGGQWVGTLSKPESIKGLQMIQDAITGASGAAKDGNETDPQVPFCADQTGIISAPGWVQGVILAEDGGCPKLEKQIGVFALPGTTPDQTAPVFLGGSNIAIAAKSENKELAANLMKVLLSDGYQTMMAEAGLVPAKTSLVSAMGDSAVAQATAKAAQNTKLTPAAPGWANVESDKIMEDLFVQIAGGGDVTALAKDADAKITAALNR